MADRRASGEITVDSTRLYVHHLVYSNDSFGRSTRVFCVSREMTDLEKHQYLNENPALSRDQVAGLPFYDGLFALKSPSPISGVRRTSGTSKRESRKRGCRTSCFPKSTVSSYVWTGSKVLDDLRGWLDPTLSPFKRTLSQFQDLAEVFLSLQDVAKGVKGLLEVGLLHRDITPGNILLAEDLIEHTVHTVTPHGLFIRRAQGPQTGGLLHNMDMCGIAREIIPETPSEHSPFTPRFEGPAPFMALGPLGAVGHHTAFDDLQSIFYVLYLLFFTSDGSALAAYPDRSVGEPVQWPEEILAWTAPRSPLTPRVLLRQKYDFFNSRDTTTPFIDVLKKDILPRWRPHSAAIAELVTALYRTLWVEVPDRGPGARKYHGDFMPCDAADDHDAARAADAFIDLLGELAEKARRTLPL
ncbi:hypothetical protein B0H17DRAFT_1072656 [Mycena rosella]|uniref:Fungal-type protein kinase domain-containing protein n=1 Tax=Mycena rosella TaxID=1033263 RepID=A0AAD7D991_MYCRO|nr:hypothetical protein B0H17DRAFT_1072656 [Mycena rosella]